MARSAGVLIATIAYLSHVASSFSFVPGGEALRTNMARQSRFSSVRSSTQPEAYMTAGSVQEDGGGQTRAGVLKTIWSTALAAGAAQGFFVSSTLAAEESVTASGLRIRKLVTGKGPTASPGDLVGVRFKGSYGTYEFDNIFNSAEPYYMRAGVGTLVKGVDEAILMMHVGDRWELTCPADLAFGNKGRPPTPGRPRIPPGAQVEYTVELVSLPGKEEDILELSDEPLTGPAFDSA